VSHERAEPLRDPGLQCFDLLCQTVCLLAAAGALVLIELLVEAGELDLELIPGANPYLITVLREGHRSGEVRGRGHQDHARSSRGGLSRSVR